MQEQSTRQRIWNCWIGMEKQWEEVHFSEEESMLKAIGENLNVGENGYETAAVIAMTEEKARELYEL